MIKKTIVSAFCAVSLFSFSTFLPSLSHASMEQPLRTPIYLNAAQFLSGDLLRGPNYWVEESVNKDIALAPIYDFFFVMLTDFAPVFA